MRKTIDRIAMLFFAVAVFVVAVAVGLGLRVALCPPRTLMRCQSLVVPEVSD